MSDDLPPPEALIEYELAAWMVDQAVELLTLPDQRLWIDGIETYFPAGKPCDEDSVLAMRLTREQTRSLQARLKEAGERPLNVITSVHQEELDWLNGVDCPLSFTTIADWLGETTERLRRALLKRLQAAAPEHYRFSCEGPLSLLRLVIDPVFHVEDEEMGLCLEEEFA